MLEMLWYSLLLTREEQVFLLACSAQQKQLRYACIPDCPEGTRGRRVRGRKQEKPWQYSQGRVTEGLKRENLLKPY